MGIRGFRNQSELHEYLSKATFKFMLNMCTQKGLVWRQEHTIQNGMRPDAICFCGLQMNYEKKHFGKDIRTGRRGEVTLDHMFIFESKVSYSDYKNSFNGSGEYKEKPYANFHYLVLPKDFSKEHDLSDLPDYWGILELNRSALKVVKYASFIEIDYVFFLEAAYTILFKWKKTFQKLEHEFINN